MSVLKTFTYSAFIVLCFHCVPFCERLFIFRFLGQPAAAVCVLAGFQRQCMYGTTHITREREKNVFSRKTGNFSANYIRSLDTRIEKRRREKKNEKKNRIEWVARCHHRQRVYNTNGGGNDSTTASIGNWNEECPNERTDSWRDKSTSHYLSKSQDDLNFKIFFGPTHTHTPTPMYNTSVFAWNSPLICIFM